MKNRESYRQILIPETLRNQLRLISAETGIGVIDLLAGFVETSIKWYYINKQNKEPVKEEVTTEYQEILDTGITENPEELKAILDNLDNLMKGVN